MVDGSETDGAGDDLTTLRRQLLEAREVRQALIERACQAGHTLVFASTNIPGPDKCPPGVRYVLGLARDTIARRLPVERVDRGQDALGPWIAFAVRLAPDAVKHATIGFESDLPAGRLLDLDVYGPGGCQVGRESVGAPARSCLVCPRPAFECIRLARHPAGEVLGAVARLLLRGLASALVQGARTELELTPKPGLVDRLDCGSHPDLSFEAMSRSIDLLPAYFEELIAVAIPLDICASVAAGQRAERRMTEAVAANAHKGYIFLAGLVLLAAAEGAGRRDLPAAIAALARRILAPRADGQEATGQPSHGARVRTAHGLGGVHCEALGGLPSVFVRGLPVLAASLQRSSGASGDGNRATAHLLMAVLMQAVEDTTAVHRCGPTGLARLRADGLRLQRLIEAGEDYVPWLEDLNRDYRRLNLTMGGVADCMALAFALHNWLDPVPRAR